MLCQLSYTRNRSRSTHKLPTPVASTEAVGTGEKNQPAARLFAKRQNGSGDPYFFLDSLCSVWRRSFGQYFINSRRSVPRVSFGTR